MWLPIHDISYLFPNFNDACMKWSLGMDKYFHLTLYMNMSTFLCRGCIWYMLKGPSGTTLNGMGKYFTRIYNNHSCHHLYKMNKARRSRVHLDVTKRRKHDKFRFLQYKYVIITGFTLANSLIHDDVIKWKHFRVTEPLCREFTGHRWIPLTKASDAEFWMLSLIRAWINGWVNNYEAGDLRRHQAHYGVTVIKIGSYRCVAAYLWW